MSVIDTNRAYASAGSAGRIGSMFLSAFNIFAAWNDTRTTQTNLDRLSDRQLDDIGLHRGQLPRLRKP
ncbi:DUF1127 domain-containing protein [Citreimonas salinaria]|uniref:YjiS-like domain-containing protein n=1 Tax=Citreimonas salinaria TaxID=321339 RepID=A0A1H3I1Z9_9RHOB|nr:DUF1127 domain-containing protein [Citreimonas salinaria]SDY21747.1 protein of unknown function [Citreimonas salinaria]